MLQTILLPSILTMSEYSLIKKERPEFVYNERRKTFFLKNSECQCKTWSKTISIKKTI